MTARTAAKSAAEPAIRHWVSWGLLAAVASAVAVLVVQALVLAARPELAAFAPLDNRLRSVAFTIVGAAGATAVFAWLTHRVARSERAFLIVAAIVLALSAAPDYLLPISGKSVAASSAAVALHAVAAAGTVGVLIVARRRRR